MTSKISMKSKRCSATQCNRFALGKLGQCKVHFFETAKGE